MLTAFCKSPVITAKTAAGTGATAPVARLAVELERPDPGVAAGQHAVFYCGALCLGGGIIE
ncbi:MAG: hypothetical protein GKR89_32955 [Candidatus Latescibacteria bacterium]|nr:hypothetical protein [Candidatus Latescibacterota bacterium]